MTTTGNFIVNNTGDNCHNNSETKLNNKIINFHQSNKNSNHETMNAEVQKTQVAEPSDDNANTQLTYYQLTKKHVVLFLYKSF